MRTSTPLHTKRNPISGVLFLFLALFLFAVPTQAQLTAQLAAPNDLLISGVIDGPLGGGTPKAVEFYVVNDIADLSMYGFGSANNGGGSDGEEFTFPADAASAGDFIYVASETEQFTNWFGFAPDYTGGAANINGDDAIELFFNDMVVDTFGEIDTDGSGEPWEYMDGWAYREDGTGPDGSTFVLDNWFFSGPNALDGEMSNATAATPFPTASYMPPAMSTGMIVVNTNADENNSDGDCSLREAVEAANTNMPVDACEAGTIDGDVITFENIFFISLNPELGELTILDDVSIDGSAGGNAVAIDGFNATRIFNVDAAGGVGDEQAVAFQSLALSNGNSTVGIANGVSSTPDAGGAVDLKTGSEATFINMLIAFSTAGVNGGGIHGAGNTNIVITTVEDGLTTISGNDAQGDAAGNGGGGVWGAGSTTITGNVVIDGNTASGTAGSGGGVFNFGGTLDITGATISNNTANRAGGGIEDFGDDDGDTDVTLTDVTLSGNSIAEANPGNGGGLHSGGGNVVVSGGTVSGNTAVEGGGLWASGTLDVDGTEITGNTGTGDDASNGGGGVYAESGATVTIDSAMIDGNQATGASGSGGGILVADGASVSMTLGSISGNAANRAGGGIEVGDDGTTDDASSITLSRVTVDGNTIADAAPGNGGGLHVGGAGSATITQSTFSNNTAAEGAGLWISGSGSLDLGNSTVSGNTATGEGGGVYGIDGADIALMSVTVANNAAGSNGGGLGQGVVEISTFSLQNTIVGNNTADGTGDDCFGTYQSDGFNLIEDTDGCTIVGDVATNITGVDPDLEELDDNGGPTMTHALMDTSPALSAGNSTFDADQRGVDRDNQDDIGSFESGIVVANMDCPETLIISDFSGPGNTIELRNNGTETIDFANVECSIAATVSSVYFSTSLTEGTLAPTETRMINASTDLRDPFSGLALLDRADAPPAGTSIQDIQPDIIASLVYLKGDRVYGFFHRDEVQFQAQCADYAPTRLHPFAQSQCAPAARMASGEAAESGPVAVTLEEMTTAALAEVNAAAQGDAGDVLPTEFALGAAYPNPFQRQATLTVEVPEASDVRVVVYDMLGRTVATLMDAPAETGRHEVVFDAAGLASGAYVVRMTAGSFVTTQRITVVR